jgi:hypothetical protein
MRRLVRELGRILLAAFFGVAATAALLVFIFFLDALTAKDSTSELDERTPLAWILTWPEHLWGLFLKPSAAFYAMFMTHVVVFSLVAYVVIRIRGHRLRLP